MNARLLSRLAGALGLVCAVVASAGHPADARDAEDINVSRSKGNVIRDYPSIPAQNPSGAASIGPSSFVAHRPSDCRTAAYCDVIDVNIDGRAFGDRDNYEMEISLRWDNPETNDLDFYLYDQEAGKRVNQGATGDQPEQMLVDRPETGKLFVVVNNFSGPNLGYTLEIDLRYVGLLKAIPKFNRATPRPPLFTPLPEATARPRDNTIARPKQELTPSATLAPVLTPGPDGALASLALEGVQAGGRVADGGAPWWIVAISTIAVVGVLGGSGFLVFRRVRARSA